MNTVSGLPPKHLSLLREIFSRFPEVGEVVLYGSRAKGTANERSDADLVITGKPVSRHITGDILSAFEESDFPYLVDLQHLNDIQNPDLLAHIERVGRVIYRREAGASPPKHENGAGTSPG
ncbi:MAG: nucleotidyltransferase domain-containing protein [Candidatus Cyclonatronum sp.]|uniref:nucleotidyltransferase domain-containing protein n=1 Tax=Cyclonatronum sp. TaxID=3024185 RepID=UPI0025C21752|nr:nucleotidyltransferase domain-containing protein [Cyclonatronum sp.]MCH8488210.1 nucleotidyltransferase domain-containing protein [Cyclonatronum sp.]